MELERKYLTVEVLSIAALFLLLAPSVLWGLARYARWKKEQVARQRIYIYAVVLCMASLVMPDAVSTVVLGTLVMVELELMIYCCLPRNEET